MEILLCGFEPFGERSVNNAWEVARQFKGSPNIDVMKLPVSFYKAHKNIIENISHKKYDLILIIGETGFTTDYVRLERVAINYKDSLNPDNDGMRADDEEIIPDAPNAFFTAFPIKKVTGMLKGKGHKVKASNSAGTFVCNSTYYYVLHYLSENATSPAALFVHVPASTDIVTLTEMRQTISGIIEEYSKLTSIV